MRATTLCRWAYRISAVLGLAYAVYVVVLKLSGTTTGGPLGDVGEFLLMLACVTLFSVGLFADETARASAAREAHGAQARSNHPKETT
jgi:high-affinity Fe2+/Pb2+ permease